MPGFVLLLSVLQHADQSHADTRAPAAPDARPPDPAPVCHNPHPGQVLLGLAGTLLSPGVPPFPCGFSAVLPEATCKLGWATWSTKVESQLTHCH